MEESWGDDHWLEVTTGGQPYWLEVDVVIDGTTIADAPSAAGGTCPHCGFWNAPESNMRDAGDRLVFCAQCHRTWSAV